MLTVYSECKTEKQNNQREQGQPMEQTSLYCMCGSGVAHCRSQLECRFWRMSSMLEAYCTSKLGSCQLICVIHEAMNGCKKSNGSLKNCFENVNILRKTIEGYFDSVPSLTFNTIKLN